MPEDTRKNGFGGGVFLAIGPIAGAVIGSFFGQPSGGLLVGLALGIVAMTLMWWRSR